MIRIRPPLVFLLVLFGMISALSGPAMAGWAARYFLFDRAIWSPDSRSVAVVGRYINSQTGESFEDTLVVDAETGAYRCVSPSITRFVLSRDRTRILGLGRWGLYDHEIATGRTKMLRSADPFTKNEIAVFSYDRTTRAAICIRCSDDYPESSGVYSYPLNGGEPVRLLPDPACGGQSLNYWQTHRRDVGPTEFNLPTGDDPTIIDNFPGTLWQIKVNDKAATAVWGNGSVPPDTLCRDCRVEVNSWPTGGGLALVSTAPEDIRDLTTPGDLWLVKSNVRTRHLTRGRFEQVAWHDSVSAIALARPGVLWAVNVASGSVSPVPMSLAPEWLRKAPAASPAQIWTLRFADEVYAHPDSARAHALGFRPAGIEGYGVDPLPNASGYTLSVGAFSDSAAAVRARAELLKHGNRERPQGRITVQRRPVSAMLGQFNFGSLKSPDGRRELFFHSHPHMFQPFMASEVWIRTAAGARPRLAVRSMSNF